MNKQSKEMEEFDKVISKHLYTCADYSISSDKIDNEILKTTGESIKNDIKQFINDKFIPKSEEEKRIGILKVNVNDAGKLLGSIHTDLDKLNQLIKDK